MKIVRTAMAGWLAFAAGSALGCGYCIEDRIAAVYDHAIVERAKAQGHEMAFLALEATAAPGATDAASLRKAVEAIPGVDRGSVRVDVAQGALSVAFDPRRIPPGKLVDQVTRAAGASMSLLRFGAPGGKPGT